MDEYAWPSTPARWSMDEYDFLRYNCSLQAARMNAHDMLRYSCSLEAARMDEYGG